MRSSRSHLAGALIFVLAATPAVGVHAQEELPLKRDLAKSASPDCEPGEPASEPDPEARAQAAELASIAEQALILGDLDRARSVLERAIDLDPVSGELAYRRARVLQDLGEQDLAASEYCRAIAEAGGADAFGDARERMEQLSAREEVIPEGARTEALRGISAAQSGDFDEALTAFDAAIEAAPSWAEIVYNRGVTLARLGRNVESALALRRYLELEPSAPDAVEVSRRIGQLEVLVVALEDTPNPLTALTLGAFIPGMGQFYSGRARGGFLVVALTAATVAGGVLITEIDVRCQERIDPGDRCPAEEVLSRSTERPHFGAALGLAGAIAAFGAVEAFMHARMRRNGRDPYGPRLSGPSISARGTDRVDLNLVSLRFR